MRQDLLFIVNDINRYLNEDENLRTNRALIGQKHLFRRFALKTWMVNDWNSKKAERLIKQLSNKEPSFTQRVGK